MLSVILASKMDGPRDGDEDEEQVDHAVRAQVRRAPPYARHGGLAQVPSEAPPGGHGRVWILYFEWLPVRHGSRRKVAAGRGSTILSTVQARVALDVIVCQR